jgi:hypothetical protein
MRGYSISKEYNMGLATVFRVFKNSSLVTSRGELQISRVFPDHTSAKKAHYRFFAIDNGILIYSRRAGTGLVKYAYIGD